MDMPTQSMPPPAMNGAASMSNGHTQYSPPQLSAQNQLQNQDQSQFNHQNGAQQHISAGTLLDICFMSLRTTLTCFGSDEIALYDRQIRLWGVKAQEKYEALSVHSSIPFLIISKASDRKCFVDFYESSCKRDCQEPRACWHWLLDNTGQSSGD